MPVPDVNCPGNISNDATTQSSGTVQARQCGRVVDCREGGGAPSGAFGFHGAAPPIAFDVHLEDRGVVDQPVDGREGHSRVREDPVPFAEGLVRGDQDGSSLVSGRDQFEQDAGLGLILGDIGEVVEDQQIELVELGDGGLELQFAAGDLQLLDQIGGSGEEHAPAVLDQREADGGREMALAAAGWPEHEDIGPLGQPAVARGHGHDLRFRE